MYYCAEGKVYNASEWAACSGILKEFASGSLPKNPHRNPLKGMSKRTTAASSKGGGAAQGGGSGKQGKKKGRKK